MHPKGRSRCFVFDGKLNLRDSTWSKPKRTVTPYIMYVFRSNVTNTLDTFYTHSRKSCYNYYEVYFYGSQLQNYNFLI